MGGLSSSFAPVITFNQTLEEAFPDVDPNYVPAGSLVLIQLQLAKRVVGEAGINLPDEAVATIQQNVQVGKVIAHGPLAFRNRTTGELWPEGAWIKIGDFVRTPKYGGDRWEVKHKDGVVMFLTQRDLDVSGIVPRPLEMIAYV